MSGQGRHQVSRVYQPTLPPVGFPVLGDGEANAVKEIQLGLCQIEIHLAAGHIVVHKCKSVLQLGVCGNFAGLVCVVLRGELAKAQFERPVALGYLWKRRDGRSCVRLVSARFASRF